MSKRLLFINGNFFPEPTGIGKYSGEMIDWLSQNGFECTVVTTYPYYPQWKIQTKYTKDQFWFKKEIRYAEKKAGIPITIIRCPHFVPKIPTGITRLVSEMSIFFSAYLVILVLLFVRKFNYVLTVAPPFELGLLGVLYKKIRGAKFLYHIQDLQIDAARDLGMIKSDFIINRLLKVEAFIIKNADQVSSISDGMIKKIKNKCNTPGVVFFPNWVDTQKFFPIVSKGEIKENFGFLSTDKIILYSGAIGEKQGLQSIIQLAKNYLNISNIKFVICGSGPYKQNLIKIKEDASLDNIIFLALQPYEKFNQFLNMADIHLVLQKAHASDLVMPSKLSTILSVGGVAIVTANSGTSLHKIMNSVDMGILIDPEDDVALINAIDWALNNDLTTKSANARTYAETHLSIAEILPKYACAALNYEHREAKNIKIDQAMLT